ncbi:Uncharacterised protein [Slackia heliotrinireducens]|nr:Uncharacterised protein [Slackia heliotrinireducens]
MVPKRCEKRPRSQLMASSVASSAVSKIYRISHQVAFERWHRVL